MKSFEDGLRVTPTKNGCIVFPVGDDPNMAILKDAITFTSWYDFHVWVDSYKNYMAEISIEATDDT